ncbi:lantibiotic dehydratase [Micromonospora sp. CA-263727]|uniref:lantibiotic dehydratase n=1 Tax=Micromonospora sp. CA-263727 TaxID=3239967 RepID=UPI003D8D11D0
MPDPTLAGGWRVWRQFALRGPGFPAEGVLRLAPPGLGEAADKFGEGTAGAAMSGPDWDAFVDSFGDAAVRTAGTLQQIAAQPSFQAAVAWQNRAVLRSGIAPFLAWQPSAAGRTSMPRQREELVAHYWQRFCVKNDTIGFFGPVGWGRFDPGVPGVEVASGDRLIARSEVYFSSWAIDALARSIEADPAVRRWLPPRRVAFVRVTGDTVTMPGRPPAPIDALGRRVLALCDGVRTPETIATAVGESPPAVLTVLGELLRRRLVVWRIEVPASAHPDRELRRRLEAIGDPEIREAALEKLRVLERAREGLRPVVRDPEALVPALAAMEASFIELTRSAAQRDKGAKSAPCRALAYSDSLREATVRVGPAVVDSLAPLSLCLTAARWLVHQFADVALARIRAAYEQLRADNSTVHLSELWMRCMPNPYHGAPEDAERISQRLRQLWSEIIAAPAGARRVHRSSAELAARVRDVFDEPGRGWSLARYMSPDVLLLAADVAAARRGDVDVVLGEMHVGTNTLTQSLFVLQHPDAAELFAETDIDYPGPRLMPMLPKESVLLRWSTRNRHALIRPADYLVGPVDHTADPHRPRTLMGADVRVDERDGELVAVLPDGAVFDLLDVFGHALTNQVMNRFSLRPAGDHAPRVVIDRMVVSRESWRFPVGDLAFAAEKSEPRRFVLARRWRDSHDVPRFAFVVLPTEPRPFYVDFDSPVYVNILAKAVRRLHRRDPAGAVTVTEMLPAPHQTWLTDEQGARYCAELRLVVVDQTSSGS